MKTPKKAKKRTPRKLSRTKAPAGFKRVTLAAAKRDLNELLPDEARALGMTAEQWNEAESHLWLAVQLAEERGDGHVDEMAILGY